MLDMTVSRAKMAELIDAISGILTWVSLGLRNHVLDCGAYSRHLANTIQRSILVISR